MPRAGRCAETAPRRPLFLVQVVTGGAQRSRAAVVGAVRRWRTRADVTAAARELAARLRVRALFRAARRALLALRLASGLAVPSALAAAVRCG
jgi:hypothetical protein